MIHYTKCINSFYFIKLRLFIAESSIILILCHKFYCAPLSESQDYERLVLNVGLVDREIPWEIDIINDNLALEFVEELLLNFEVNPLFQIIIDRTLAVGEFIRDSVIVSIADNDGKNTQLFCILSICVIHIKSDMTTIN